MLAFSSTYNKINKYKSHVFKNNLYKIMRCKSIIFFPIISLFLFIYLFAG